MQFPPREVLLAPWLVSSSINMLTAYRGTGKTWAALSIATAVASAGQFLTFQAPAPKQVLYIDGEMPAIQLQERLRYIVEMMPAFNPDNLAIISPDIQSRPLPDLSTLAGQIEFNCWTDKADLIVVDNLSSLARTGVENDAESWTAIARWALRMRREGRAVLFIHHAGKSGQQRGTSKREDLLDTSILLTRPEDAEPGACFTWEWSKARGLHGKDMEPLHAELVAGATGRLAWTCRSDGDIRLAEARVLKAQGKSVRQASEEMGISKTTVGRLFKRLEALDA
jgi:putative DNA primase/helicase